ncbi:putative thioredoxin domain-containing protein 16-like [Apostichopus japonicus]|uniref:Putative thioredoxin domain-containing protein 16-like n=1 Tax=Stichopus japonicus TaxID=307972 RepID=A0A2G8KWZ7_STIJA|nr:putative thioredoxin domain-containing protein 16-like [Apostichopus japonicus]
MFSRLIVSHLQKTMNVMKKKEDSDKVHFFRHGRLLTDLPLDSMFNFDAIVANILHLVLLQEVPLLQTRAELEEMMRRTSGKRDVIFARMRAVGIFEDRAFIETAFAFNQKYQFIMTTVNDNFGIDSNWEPGSNSIWLLQCKNTIPGKQCPAIPFMNAISLEKLIVFIKGLEVTNAKHLSMRCGELTEGSHVGFLHLTIPVVYLSGSKCDIQGLRSTMHTLAAEFMGNVGFILVNRDTVTENMQAIWDLSTSLKCTSVCAVLETEDSLEMIDEFTIEDLRLGLKKILEKQKSEDLEHKEDDEDIDEDEDEDEVDGSSEELYSTSQETQDDPVEVALFKLQADRQLNISETVQLTDKTFPEFISSTSVTMVLFTVKYVGWFGKCYLKRKQQFKTDSFSLLCVVRNYLNSLPGSEEQAGLEPSRANLPQRRPQTE